MSLASSVLPRNRLRLKRPDRSAFRTRVNKLWATATSCMLCIVMRCCTLFLPTQAIQAGIAERWFPLQSCGMALLFHCNVSWRSVGEAWHPKNPEAHKPVACSDESLPTAHSAFFIHNKSFVDIVFLKDYNRCK